MNSPRDTRPTDADRSWLSAAMDGDAEALDRTANRWRDDPEARATWHRYHLIGDVLRSSELAQPAARDADFLQGIRQRLAAEPVVLAPTPTLPQVQPPAPRHAASRWAVPAAVAAGFVVVAGVLVVSRLSGPSGMGSQDTLASASSATRLVNASVAGRAPQALAQDSGAVLRDPRVDELLRMHQAARSGMAVPGSALRRVDNVVTVEQPR